MVKTDILTAIQVGIFLHPALHLGHRLDALDSWDVFDVGERCAGKRGRDARSVEECAALGQDDGGAARVS